MKLRMFSAGMVLPAVLLVAGVAQGQAERYGRRGKPLPPAPKISVMVEKAANGKPVENAAVIFHVFQNGRPSGTMEVKTDPDGMASIDVIEAGSHVQVQVIADGFATNAMEFDLGKEEKTLRLKMEKPRAQVSAYENNDGKPAQIPAGVQEPRHVAPKVTKPSAATAMPQAKGQTTPAAPVTPSASPETAPPSKPQ